MIELNRIYQGDCLELLRTMPDGIADTCITSPPYYGLRDYGTATWEGGDKECKHMVCGDGESAGEKQKTNNGSLRVAKDVCPHCGARRIDSQIGLEQTPEAYIQKLVEVFREVRRVLKPSGTLWVNIGDSYAGGGGGNYNKTGISQAGGEHITNVRNRDNWLSSAGLKPKDLIMIPAMLALALRADGWYLRSEIVWHKPNPMPESVTDRPTKSHEMIYLLSKSRQYFYDYTAILEPANYDGRKDTIMKGSEKYENGFYPTDVKAQSIAVVGHERWKNKMPEPTRGYKEKPNNEENPQHHGKDIKGYSHRGGGDSGILGHSGSHDADGNLIGPTIDGIPARNKRSVWSVTTRPYAEAHFATFPEELIVPCIKAGSSEHGCCPGCGRPWERVTDKNVIERERPNEYGKRQQGYGMNSINQTIAGTTTTTTGWRPTCTCGKEPVPAVILDPFMGAGTTALVARKLNRNFIGCELNPEYIKIAEKRLYNEIGLFL